MKPKMQIKNILVRGGLWYRLNLLRKTPEILRWLGSGCSGAAPYPIKLMVVRYYLTKYSIDNFVETGTYLGDTLGYIAETGVHCTSIELSEKLYEERASDLMAIET